MSTAEERKRLRPISDRLASVEHLCHQARLKMAGGNQSNSVMHRNVRTAIALASVAGYVAFMALAICREWSVGSVVAVTVLMVTTVVACTHMRPLGAADAATSR